MLTQMELQLHNGSRQQAIINGQAVQLTGKFFKNNAAAGFEPNNVTPTPVVTFELSDFEGVNGAELFSQITGGLIQKPLGIFLDNKWISSPTVQTKITGGSGIITGLDINEAKVLAIQINQGALPLSLKIVQQENVGATLLASISLGIYAAIILAIFKLVPVTLSLAGIAAFILSIGMAVDANVLIFERIKEELMKGRTIGAAIDAGFHRAWSSIRDSNLTTILSCVILYFFGKQLGITMVMGFALTLLIGVIVSMFTAIIVTRTFMDLLIGTSLAKKANLFYAGSVPKNQKETATNV
ncbi:MAG: MMPL family transporter [Chloroflexi bacterium]|nr:MMPL family transporter [Chloroflexota bacterium]